MDMYEKMKRKNEFDGNLTVGAKKFNEITGRNKHLANREKKNLDYINLSTGLLKKEYSFFRKCILCDTSDEELLFIKDGFRHVRCKKCQMVYVNPTLSDEKAHAFYLDEESYNLVLTNQHQVEMDKKRFNYSLDIIEHFLPNRGKIMDIGAGPGFFLHAAQDRGWEVSAVEFNRFCVNKLKEAGIPVINKPLQQVSLGENLFDCVTIWAVLEHILEPNSFLNEIYKILKPRGILAILVPNIDSLAARVLHDKCVTFSGDSHINFFNDNTLSEMLKKHSFRKIECETLFSEINTVQNYLGYQNPYLGETNFNLPLLSPEYIHCNMLGYVLHGFYEKNTK